MILAAEAAAVAGIGRVAAIGQVAARIGGGGVADPAALVPRIAIGTVVIIVIFAAALRLLIAEPAPDLVTGAVEEAPFVRIIIIRRAPVARPAISRSDRKSTRLNSSH